MRCMTTPRYRLWFGVGHSPLFNIIFRRTWLTCAIYLRDRNGRAGCSTWRKWAASLAHLWIVGRWYCWHLCERVWARITTGSKLLQQIFKYVNVSKHVAVGDSALCIWSIWLCECKWKRENTIAVKCGVNQLKILLIIRLVPVFFSPCCTNAQHAHQSDWEHKSEHFAYVEFN